MAAEGTDSFAGVLLNTIYYTMWERRAPARRSPTSSACKKVIFDAKLVNGSLHPNLESLAPESPWALKKKLRPCHLEKD